MKKKQLHDSIFSALRLLSKHFNLSFSKDTILSGLPLKQGHLTLELFIRASEKMGLQAKQFKKKLANIYNPTLPVVLIQNNNLVTVLLSIDRKNSSATIFSNKKESKIKLADLEKKYSINSEQLIKIRILVLTSKTNHGLYTSNFLSFVIN